MLSISLSLEGVTAKKSFVPKTTKISAKKTVIEYSVVVETLENKEKNFEEKCKVLRYLKKEH